VKPERGRHLRASRDDLCASLRDGVQDHSASEHVPYQALRSRKSSGPRVGAGVLRKYDSYPAVVVLNPAAANLPSVAVIIALNALILFQQFAAA
jgi:hypothetical protein